jgi:hypothetical protein
MGKTVRNIGTIKVRDNDMKGMILRNGDGFHDGHKRTRSRRDRKTTRQALRRGDW